MHPFEAQLAAAWPPGDWKDVTVLLAVSGGADSVALLRAMTAIRPAGEGRLVAAHLNHRLRGKDADADEAFVADLCGRLGVACEVGRVPVADLAAAAGDGIEAAARDARYGFLARTAARLGGRYVATAHTADDQAETVLHRILRGTGIAGLAGIARTRPLHLPVGRSTAPSAGEASCDAKAAMNRRTPKPSTPVATLIRPLLQFRRAEVSAYLAGLGQPYRRDASNDDPRFTRNRIRGELLPHLAERYNAGAVEALLRLSTLAGEVQAVVEALVGDLLERCVRAESPEALSIDANALAGQPDYLIREMLVAAWRGQGWPMQAMGLAEWERLAAMLAAAAGDSPQAPPKQTLPGNVLAEAVGGRLRLVRNP